jgi:hypothetical protein
MNMTHISAGRDRSVALSSDGTAYGWGGIKLLGATLPPGYPGELCTNNATEIGHNRYAQPTPQALNPGKALTAFAAIADGYVDTLAIARTGGVLSCRPVVSATHGAQHAPVAGLPASPQQVALTEAAGFAVYADGTVWSWGLPVNGQLGRAAGAGFDAPAPITGLGGIRALAAGHGHVLALDRTGRVWVWGANAAGQLGTGGLQAVTRPQCLALQAHITHIGAGDTHSFAVDDKGRLWGWGANNFGQVGDASAKFFLRAQRIRTDFTVAQIDAGMFYTAARSTHGDVFVWGWNGMGQLGVDGVASSVTPRRVKSLANVTHLAAGVGHVLAGNEQGVWAWGDNRASAWGQFPSTTVQLAPNPIHFV